MSLTAEIFSFFFLDERALTFTGAPCQRIYVSLRFYFVSVFFLFAELYGSDCKAYSTVQQLCYKFK